jgi:hypothetical protein
MSGEGAVVSLVGEFVVEWFLTDAPENAFWFWRVPWRMTLHSGLLFGVPHSWPI